MTTEDKQNRSEFTTPDLACTRCRERKIRCGRERPECRNCERDDGATCVYQNPAKRVNHIKLLCDSFDQLQSRLGDMETNIARLTAVTVRGVARHNSSSSRSSQQSSLRQQDFDDELGDDESPSDVDDATDVHVFRNKIDLADRYHGPSSLFVLCKRFRTRFLDASEATESGTHMQDLLHNLCEAAGLSEPFPSHNDQSIVHIVPKQQAVTAVGHFLQHLDIRTDIFSQSSLLANLERTYSQPLKPGDDAWVTCFKAIALLVLGMELSAQAKNALFGDFARSFLPSRAALVNSSLLITPRLINVQTLILLSVAMQQFDPHGWAELLFTHACMLARTMGLHHVPISPADAGAEESLERAKVLRSLYALDKSLCMTRGTVSWLPSHDCKITPQLKAAVERRVPYSDRIRLSMIQDDIYRLNHATSCRRSDSSSKSQATLQLIEHDLSEYASAFGIFECQAAYSSRHAMLMLEFLATRIIALQHSSQPSHAAQVRQDARASCLLLLIAHGERDHQVIEAFNTCTSRASLTFSQTESMSTADTGTIPFASILDSFSVPAFFILLEDLLQPTENEDGTKPGAGLDLLRKISACYSLSTGRMQANCYHRKVSLIFEHLLPLIGILKTGQPNQPDSAPLPVPVAEMIPPHMSSHISTFPPKSIDLSNVSMAPAPGELFSFPLTPLIGGTSLPWEEWLTMSSAPVPNTPFGATDLTNLANVPSTQSPDLLSQMMSTSHSLPDSSLQPTEWPTSTSGPSSSRKRQRTHEESQDQAEEEGPSPLSKFLVSGQEVPFHLIS